MRGSHPHPSDPAIQLMFLRRVTRDSYLLCLSWSSNSASLGFHRLSRVHNATMSDISLQLRELCQLHKAGHLSDGQFERAKEAVISAALAQASSVLSPPKPVPSLRVRSAQPLSPPSERASGQFASFRTVTSSRRTRIPTVVPLCPGGHGALDFQTLDSIPSSWQGKLSCSHCSYEGQAKRFLGCRRCDYDLCPECVRRYETPLALPTPSCSLPSAEKEAPSPLTQSNYSPVAPRTPHELPTGGEPVVLGECPPARNESRARPGAPTLASIGTVSAASLTDDETGDVPDVGAPTPETPPAPTPKPVREGEAGARGQDVLSEDGSFMSLASGTAVSERSAKSKTAPQVVAEATPRSSNSSPDNRIIQLQEEMSNTMKDGDVLNEVHGGGTALPTKHAPTPSDSDAGFASVSSNASREAGPVETVTRIVIPQPRMSRIVKKPPDPANFKSLSLASQSSTTRSRYHKEPVGPGKRVTGPL
eukprot:TRINITY_DN9954_c2_g1_i1.p1 TRINITY_DN9954_c2_g1~~TRINITY_DN9954_c2_g1_i1.p1  ORF type:complete len:477 (+),score=7.21 TRINITY_DN9954_c2_g1_i1:378-1808(+)